MHMRLAGKTSMLRIGLLLAVSSIPLVSGDGTELPKAFYVPEGAASVIHKTQRSGVEDLSYEVKEPYPAASFVSALEQSLKARGWSVPERDPLNPQLPGSTIRLNCKWTDARDAKDGLDLRDWQCQWLSSERALVRYVLRYTRAEGHQDWSNLKVVAVYWPPAVLRSMEQRHRTTKASPQPSPAIPRVREEVLVLRSETMEGRLYQHRVSAAVLEATPGWSPLDEEPPLSPREAAGIAAARLRPEAPEKAAVVSADLSAVTTQRGFRWYYVVSLYDVDQAQGSQPPPVRKVLILMDGAIIEATTG
jgi:hypothetical protein